MRDFIAQVLATASYSRSPRSPRRLAPPPPAATELAGAFGLNQAHLRSELGRFKGQRLKQLSTPPPPNPPTPPGVDAQAPEPRPSRRGAVRNKASDARGGRSSGAPQT